MTEHAENPITSCPRLELATVAGDTALVLPTEQAAQIREHARQTYPDECCGVLVGLSGDTPVVCSVHRVRNCDEDRARDRFRLDPKEILRLERAVEPEGKSILGFYHSHPDHPALPSYTDLEYAWPGYLYLIAAVREDGETELRAWRYESELRRFQEWQISSGGDRVMSRKY